MTDADVLILGGGGVGCSAALHLAQQGLRAVLLERGLVGSQASGVNYGGVRQQGRHAAELPLSRLSREIWGRLPELVGTDCEFDPCGHLKLARTEADAAALEAWNRMAREHGLAPRLIGRNAIRADHPYFSDDILAGSLLEEDGSANPRLLSPALAKAARAAGATILEHHKVEALAHDGTRFTLAAAGREFRAPVLLNTAGFWGAAVAARFGEPVPCTPLSPNMVVTEPLPYFLKPSLGVVGGDIYLRQIARGNVIFGGGHGECDPAIPVSRPRPEVTLAAMQRAAAVIPRLAGAMVIRSWSGIDGQMADGLPVIGASATTPGLFHAFGFSGHGFQLGPGTGAVLAGLVLDGRSPVDVTGFDIRRFGGQTAADHRGEFH
jgi:sarcosine oxidase subunit beta